MESEKGYTKIVISSNEILDNVMDMDWVLVFVRLKSIPNALLVDIEAGSLRDYYRIKNIFESCFNDGTRFYFLKPVHLLN